MTDADRTVRVTEETWGELNRMKDKGETFDEVISKLIQEHRDDA